jgi:hypothetical protein
MVLSGVLAGFLRPVDLGEETARAAESFLPGNAEGLAVTASEAIP